MINTRTFTGLFLAILLMVGTAFAQEKDQTAASLGLGSDLPLNPHVKVGKLANGMTYYLMQNKKPENRAAFRLAVNAGSVLETDAQQGLAHFVEHMCFNGTANFKKNQLVEYLESIGMRFGADLNAYTSFDETVYMLELPMDNEDVVTNGMQVLVDWASAVSFDNEEIDKERGVIMEEWRSRKGASSRMRDKHFPVLLKGSKYANRLPIGLPEIITGFQYETLKNFYRTWYRPDLMAIVAVGDFDVARMEEKIQKMFGSIPARPDKVQRPQEQVPDHDELLVSIASDAEATSTSVAMYFKLDPRVDRKVKDYRQSLIERLYTRMLNDRYNEILQKSNPPFIFAGSGKGGFVRSKEVYSLNTTVQDGGIARGFEALLVEAQRVKLHGFTATELERAKTNMLRSMERSWNERDKTESDDHASEFVRNFLDEEPIPGIDIEYEIYKKFLPTVTLREVNKLTADFMSNRNRVITVSMPEKAGLTPPTEKELRDILARVEAMQLDAYVDEVANKPLVELKDSKVKVASEKKYADVDVTEWTLDNGIRVLFKKTDFKADEVLFGATSPGGYSLVSTEDLPSGLFATTATTLGGVGDFDQVQLRKALTGKVVSVSPNIGGESEGFSGSFAPKDMETAFQLMYLYVTRPRKDTSAFSSFKTRMMSMMENMGNMPERVFSDTLTTTLGNYHPRVPVVNKQWLERVDLDKAYAFYNDRFRDAGDFTFYFVGNIDEKEFKPMVEKYLGQLPTIKRKESWKDHNVDTPAGVVKKEVRKGVDDKSMVAVVFSGPFEWTYENRYIIGSLEEYLTIMLREAIREDKGGTYGVGVNLQVEKFPKTEYACIINFGTNPDRVAELVATTFDVLKNVKEQAPSEENLNKIKEIQRREREKGMKENGFWISQIARAVSNNEPLNQFLAYDKLIDGLNGEMIRQAAVKYLNFDRYVQVALFPEKKAE